MKLLGRLFLVAAIAVGIAATSMGQVWAAAPVLVKQCFVTKPKLMAHNASGTQIVYVIYGKKAAKSITFAVTYRNAAQHFVRTVTDTGSFAPGVTIDHHFALYSDVTYAGATATCVPTQVKWADSTLWMAPSH